MLKQGREVRLKPAWERGAALSSHLLKQGGKEEPAERRLKKGVGLHFVELHPSKKANVLPGNANGLGIAGPQKRFAGFARGKSGESRRVPGFSGQSGSRKTMRRARMEAENGE